MSLSTDSRENRQFASELKFLISPFFANQIRDWARARLGPDPHGSGEAGDAYRITSLYFDTGRFDVFQRRGSFGRSKFRIRRYGNEDRIYLERKLKTRDLVSKRRTGVPAEDVLRLLTAGPQNTWAGYWFQRRLAVRELHPVCQISYARTARVLATERGTMRLTLDRDVRAVPVEGAEFLPGGGGLLLAEPDVILELKFRHEMPVLFKRLVEDFSLKPQAVSKYRMAVVALGCHRPPEDQPWTKRPAAHLHA